MPETISTVGIDIGTTTTSLVLARLTIQNTEAFSSLPHVQIIDKKVNYRSPIIFTPLKSTTQIDQHALRAFVAKQYQQAGVDKATLKMGAIIMTGETARKDNASQTLLSLSDFAGNFVCATAGPRLESFIAGKGANHALLTKHPERPLLNLDIGGGTTNIAYFERGRCIDTACFDIGGRLIRVDSQHRITYIAPKLQKIISDYQLPIQLGQQIDIAALTPLINQMVQVLEDVVANRHSSPYYDLLQTEPIKRRINPNALITFSGGVADCLVSALPANPFQYGDIGILLGAAIKNSAFFQARQIKRPAETIRATVIGAGSQSVTVSGSTINYSANALPLKNVPIISLERPISHFSKATIRAAIKAQLNFYQLTELTAIGIALPAVGMDFQSITKEAQLLAAGIVDILHLKIPLVVLMQKNVALFFGNCLKEHLPADYPLICLDAVSIQSGDYIDIGQPVANGQALPLIIKTLAFN